MTEVSSTPPNAIARRQIGQQRIVPEFLPHQQILLALADQVAAGGRELIVEEVVEFLAVETVGANLLIDDARRDADVGRRLPKQRHAAADAAAVIDVLAAGRADRVDEAAVMRAVGHHANRRGFAERNVDRTLEVVADIAFVDRVDVGLDQRPR